MADGDQVLGALVSLRDSLGACEARTGHLGVPVIFRFEPGSQLAEQGPSPPVSSKARLVVRAGQGLETDGLCAGLAPWQ